MVLVCDVISDSVILDSVNINDNPQVRAAQYERFQLVCRWFGLSEDNDLP